MEDASKDILLRISNQLIGNIGLYYVCYELSKRGWNALPTSRNTRGIDIVIYSQDAVRKYTIQEVSNPLGNTPDSLMLII